MFLILTVCSDVGGYVAGITIGRHLMAPAISPKKTWEGFGGSAFACMLGGAISLPLLLHGAIWQGILLGAAALVSATLGDLAESMIKRDLQIKDMGTVLPGHGGILDRIDSLLITAPVVWVLLLVFVPVAPALTSTARSPCPSRAVTRVCFPITRGVGGASRTHPPVDGSGAAMLKRPIGIIFLVYLIIGVIVAWSRGLPAPQPAQGHRFCHSRHSPVVAAAAGDQPAHPLKESARSF